MKKVLSCISFFFLLSLGVNGQTFDWAFRAGDSLFQSGNAIDVDPAGNVIVGGEFYGLVDFDPGPMISSLISVNYNSDAFITKYDANSNFLWAVSIFSGGWDWVECIKTDSAGNIYAGGTMAYGNAFIEKRDSSGNLLWHHNFHYNTSSYNTYNNCLSLAVDDSGNVYATGFFYGLTIFSYSPYVQMTSTNGINNDAFIAKLNSQGDLVWAKQIGNSFRDIGSSIALDKAGNIYCTGTFTDTVDFDPGPGTYFLNTSTSTIFNNDIFIVKLDNGGNFIWAKSFYGTFTSDQTSELALNNNADLVLAGRFDGIIDFDPDTSHHYLSGEGSYVCSLDSAGHFIMAKEFENIRPVAIGLDQAGNIYTTGYFFGIADFDPGPGVYTLNSLGHTHGFISRLNQNGDFLSVVSLSGNSHEIIHSIAVNDSDNILTTGYFSDTADFDPSGNNYLLSSAGDWDAFVWKLSRCNSPYQQLSLTGCDSLVSNGQAFFNSGTYLQTLINSAGCDSTIVLQITINQSSDSIFSLQDCDSITANGQTFFNSGTYLQTLINSSGCDSTIVLQLTINQSYDSTFSIQACDSVSVMGQTFYNSGTYFQTFINSSGCDSTIILQLTINQTSDSTVAIQACDSINANGQTFYNSGTYIQTLTNSVGCDSIILLQLTINNSYDSILTVQACDSFQFNGINHTASGTYNYVYSNVFGCDSILNLILSINIIDTSVTQNGITLTANATGLAYEWLDCSNNYQPIPGANNEIFTPSINGNYAVVVSDSSCSDTSSCHLITSVGIADITNKNRCYLFPNPVNDFLQLRLNSLNDENLSIEIFDVTGKKVFSKQEHLLPGKSVLNLNIENLSTGIYTLKIKGNSFNVVKQVVKVE